MTSLDRHIETRKDHDSRSKAFLQSTLQRPLLVLLIPSILALFGFAGCVTTPTGDQLDASGDSDILSKATEFAKSGDPEAQYLLGCMYLTGHDQAGHKAPRDSQKAFHWLSKAAENGHPIAQNNLAKMYVKGDGVPQNHVKAVQWFERSAAQGHADAQLNLGYSYGTGRGVPLDHKAAFKWYSKAAEQGNSQAQNNLGLFYRDGLGVPKDHEKAAQWYKKAAAQGNVGARISLEELGNNE